MFRTLVTRLDQIYSLGIIGSQTTHCKYPQGCDLPDVDSLFAQMPVVDIKSDASLVSYNSIMESKQPSSREEKHTDKSSKKSEAACLDIIKRMNGFKESLWKDMDKIQIIELVLEDFGLMSMFNRFKGLKSLTLINVGISVIQGLTECVKLEALWLNQNSISKIAGLEKNVNLKSLYLSHNLIKKIQGLATLSKLETLWLCDNQIQTLENLGGLKSLKQLWIASNAIQYVKTSLDSLTELTDLNISGNKICSFKEVLNLNRLPNLRMLSLYDPHFGENPICTLCNYQTYMLYHLRSIIKLDTLQLSQEAKIYAENTYMRKKMYYNMRIKTIERHFSTLSKLIKKASLIKLDSINEDIENINVKLRDPACEDENIRDVYDLRIEELLHIREVYQAVKKRLLEISKISIRKLLTELETGGNIRLEQGKPEDKWYKSCEDLIKSRYNESDLASQGISGINFKRVIRIHNRFLKQKFEEKNQSIIDMSSASYKKNIEYLFFGMDPNSPQEVDHIMEEGFRTVEESKKLGLCPYTPLVHTLLAGDLPRLTSYIKGKTNDAKFDKDFIRKRNLGPLKLYPSGWLLVCKVPMIKSTSDEKYPFFNPEIPASQILKQNPLDPKDNQYTIIRVKQTDPRIKIWFMLDNSLVLPQYYVEFEYVLSSPNQSKVADFGDTIAVLETQSDEFIGPMSAQEINQIYNNLVSEIGNYQFQNIQDGDNSNLEIQAADLDRIDLGYMKTLLINYFKYCLCRSNIYHSLNENNSLQTTEEFDFGKMKLSQQITRGLKFINLSNLKIKDISFMKELPNLETAILSCNNISRLTDLEKCPTITTLDLNHNNIDSLAGLSALKMLSYLDLSHNELQSAESLRLLELNENIQDVNILFNPFRDPKEAENVLLKTSKFLQRVNYMDVAGLTSKFGQKSNKEANDTIIQRYLAANNKLFDQNNLEKLEALHINYEKIVSMKGIEELINLRRLNLSHNRITRIEHIENCKLLQELNLEDNQISQITNLDKLVFLKNLQLGKNRITKVEGISTLTNLTQLSIEDNILSSLEGFPEIKSLMELYLGNNKIVQSQEVKHLKDLQKLIILDMSGNPLSKDSSYRIYTLYVLRKLKVLDGISIQGFEQQQAREHFTGRLTQEILREKLDGATTQNVKNLDLRNSKLKDFDDMFNSKHFPNLSQFDISYNEFTSMKMLGHLPNLSILVLQHNKIESLLCSTDLNVMRGLNGCQNLYIIDLSHNYLKDFNGLQFCKLAQLKILRASRNEITKIDNLENLRQLKQLDVNHNKIRQLDPLSFEIKNVIKCLKIDDNGLKSFNNIQKLTKLHFLFAHSNRIQEFHDIDRLMELDHLTQLELNGNSLCRRGGYRMTMIKRLPNINKLDGKDVTSEERMELQINQPPVMPPNYMQIQLNQKQVPVRMSSVDFGGVFTTNRLGMEGLLNQQIYGNPTNIGPKK